MRLSILVILFILNVHSIYGQSERLKIGQWRSHIPYITGIYATQSNEAVFYATEYSILKLDKESQEVEFFSKVDGLSNVGVRLVKYHPFSDKLMVVYNNGVIDLIKDKEVETLNQIRNFANFAGEKRINDVFPAEDENVYLAANYGISKLDVVTAEFKFTTFTGIEVNGVVVFDNSLYIATAEGVYRTPLSNPIPEDFDSWELLSAVHGIPIDDYSSNALSVFNDRLYMDVNNSLFSLEKSGVVSQIHQEPRSSIVYITGEGANLLVGYKCMDPSICGGGKILYFNQDHTSGQLPAPCMGLINYAIQDQNGKLYLGDFFRDYRILNDVSDPNCTFLSFNSPFSINSKEMAIGNNQVWITGGGVNQTFSNQFSRSGFYALIDGQWKNFNIGNTEILKGENPNDANDDLLDFITVAIRPDNGEVYLGSFFEGLIAYDGTSMKLYNEKNSTLGFANGDPNRTRVSGLAFDDENNLWMSNHLSNDPISVLMTDGSWKSFRPSCNRTELQQLDVDDKGYKWIIDGSAQAGLIVFDEGNINDSNDDRCKTFTESNSNLPTNAANCLAADLDGNVWVGTTKGILIFECGDPFDDNCIGSLRGFEEGGFVELLLNTEDIQSIAVDGANRKWIGTKNGVFLLSPNGDEEILRFNTGNSPIFDNNIIDIAINDENGEVYFATNNGVISYRSDAIAGKSIHKSTLKVFPNPVEPGYDGPIAIQGLANNATVKITNITGELVYETKSLGGQAIWYGTDYNGRRVNSGVYMVFSSTDTPLGITSKPDAAVAKIVFIN